MTSHRQKIFEQLYQSGIAPWDTDQPQPALVSLVEAGAIRGPVLDVGCGSGANALFLAQAGMDVVGVDFAPRAIELARQRTPAGIPIRWVLGDVRETQVPSVGFSSVLDIGVLHTLPESERPGHIDHLRGLLAPGGCIYVICFCSSIPAMYGAGLSQEALQRLFCNGWQINELSSTYFIGRHTMDRSKTTFAGPKAWILSANKVSC